MSGPDTHPTNITYLEEHKRDKSAQAVMRRIQQVAPLIVGVGVAVEAELLKASHEVSFIAGLVVALISNGLQEGLQIDEAAQKGEVGKTLRRGIALTIGLTLFGSVLGLATAPGEPAMPVVADPQIAPEFIGGGAVVGLLAGLGITGKETRKAVQVRNASRRMQTT